MLPAAVSRDPSDSFALQQGTATSMKSNFATINDAVVAAEEQFP
jgi:hypothetical protein